MNRIFLDMDGVIVDFDGYMNSSGLRPHQIKRMAGCYRDMAPIPGAIDGVRRLLEIGNDVWIATKPPTGVAHAYSEKAQWVFDHLPELERKLIVTPDKGLLGDSADILVDDRPHKANCAQFPGSLIGFDPRSGGGWHWLLGRIFQEQDNLRGISRRLGFPQHEMR